MLLALVPRQAGRNDAIQTAADMVPELNAALIVLAAITDGAARGEQVINNGSLLILAAPEQAQQPPGVLLDNRPAER